jgi:hypothetical protein
MGVTYGDLRKKIKSKTFSKKINSETKEIKGNNIKRRITYRNSSKMINIFKVDNDNKLENNIQSKTDKTLDPKKNEEILDKFKKNEIKKLRCLSAENLLKLVGNQNLSENHNHDEICPNSLDTNFSSNQSKGEILNKILTDEMDNDNSIDNEEEEEEESEENDDNKKKEENKINNLMITNNIKSVFVDSKIQGKDQNENSININVEEDNNRDIGSRSSSATFDYELNFYKSGTEIRQSYISKLISMNVWNPSMKPKQHNSIIIFDWDDTLLPTSFLTPGGIFNEEIQLTDSDVEKLKKIEECVFLLLTESIEKGNVYIITNAGKGWVEFSANKFYPSILGLLKKIEIISARGEYEKIFPGNSRQWKIEAFLNLLKYVNIKLVTNIICIGDSLFEMEAGRILASKFKEAFIKTIKFREAPKLDELIKQLKLVCHQFNSIYSSIKNLTIRVEKKKKDSI